MTWRAVLLDVGSPSTGANVGSPSELAGAGADVGPPAVEDRGEARRRSTARSVQGLVIVVARSDRTRLVSAPTTAGE